MVTVATHANSRHPVTVTLTDTAQAVSDLVRADLLDRGVKHHEIGDFAIMGLKADGSSRAAILTGDATEQSERTAAGEDFEAACALDHVYVQAPGGDDANVVIVCFVVR